MASYWVIFAFVTIGALALNAQEPGRETVSRTPIFALCLMMVVMLAVFAGIRSPTSDADYINYVEWFNALNAGSSAAAELIKDPVFIFFAGSFRLASGSLMVLMLAVGLASLLIKVRVLHSKEYAGLLGFGLLFIVARFFLLHEFTQVRASLGIALATLGLVYSVEGQRAKGLIVFFLATMTHVSVLAMLPLLVISDRWSTASKTVIVVALGTMAGAVLLLTDTATTLFSSIVMRMLPYFTGEYEVSENTLISAYFLIKTAMLLGVWVQWRSLSAGMRLAVIASTYGVGLTIAFLSIDILSLRLSELVAVFDCLCFAYLFRVMYLRAPIFAVGAVVVLAAALFGASLGIVHDYDIIR